MVTKYRLVNWQFNQGAWCQAMREACHEFEVEEVARVMGVANTTVINWKNGKFHAEFAYPNMTNFLMFCNTFDKDVRDFFEVVDA